MANTASRCTAGPPPASVDRLREKVAFRVWHPVVLDNEKALALEDATKAYEEAHSACEAAWAKHLLYPASEADKAALDAARAALAVAAEAHEAAREAAEESTLTLTLRAPTPETYQRISAAHPPTDGDREQWRKLGDEFPESGWPKESPTTFPPALIAAALVDPPMTEDEVRAEIWDNPEWNEAEKAALYLAAYATNNRATVSLAKLPGPPSPPRRPRK